MSLAHDRLMARLSEVGRLSVAEFMAEALYGPGGYYRQARNPVGPQGDFYTSARVHPAFAALLAVQIAQIWETWGRPARFDVVEPGGGHGTLATDLAHALRDFSPELAAAVAYRTVDWQRDASLPQGPPPLPEGIRGVVVANELLDALPVERVQKLGGKLQQLYITLDGDRLVERPFPIATSELQAYVAGWEQLMPEGGVAEAHIEAARWIGQLGAALERGLAILLDYADERPALLERGHGSLRAYRRHRIVDDPYADPGEVDITCHVDLAMVRSAAREHGLEIAGEATQAEFLNNLGMKRIHDALAAAPLPPEAKEANLAALHDLVSPTGFGGFRAIGLARGLGDLPLHGWHGGGEPASAPVLTRRHMTLW